VVVIFQDSLFPKHQISPDGSGSEVKSLILVVSGEAPNADQCPAGLADGSSRRTSLASLLDETNSTPPQTRQDCRNAATATRKLKL